MRSRWAAAVVLLASMLLWTLCSPAPAADRPAPAYPAAQQHGPAEAVPGAVDMPEDVGKPLSGEGDASHHRPHARPPRAPGTAGAAGPAHPTAGAQRRSVPRPYPMGPPPGRGPVGPVPSAAGLQTFRC
ncbi:hypothetical protein [Streptomyces sp. NPDC005009]